MNKYKHIVFCGGGGFALSQLSAYYECIEHQILNYKNIKSIYSTSAGGVVGVLIAFNYTKDILIDYFEKRPWYKLFEPITDNVLNIYDKKGIYDKTLFKKMFEPLFFTKNIKNDITLKEVYDKTNITHYFYTIKIDDLSIREFSHVTDPDMMLLDAIYLSCCFPFVFQPGKYKDNYYLDGGLFINYPIEPCIKRNLEHVDEIITFTHKKSIINEKYKNIDCESIENMNIISYSTKIVYLLVHKLNHLCNHELYSTFKDDIQEVCIPLPQFDTMSYSVIKNQDYRTELIRLGENTVKNQFTLTNQEENEKEG
jgi:predicted acylesterase/phospholipase RssA